MGADERYEGYEDLEVLEVATRYSSRIASLFEGALSLPREGAKVADFGAGIGTITRAFTERSGVRPVAIERDDVMRARLVRDGFKAVSDLAELEDSSLDLVFSSNVLEHIDDDRAILEALRTKLRRGGRLALYVPAFPILWTSLDDRVGHRRRYTRASLESAVRDAGFRVLSISYRDCIGFAAALAYRFARPRSTSLDVRSVRFYDRVLFPISDGLDSRFAPPFGKNLYLLAEAP